MSAEMFPGPDTVLRCKDIGFVKVLRYRQTKANAENGLTYLGSIPMVPCTLQPELPDMSVFKYVRVSTAGRLRTTYPTYTCMMT
jgi:hypothetical protein